MKLHYLHKIKSATSNVLVINPKTFVILPKTVFLKNVDGCNTMLPLNIKKKRLCFASCECADTEVQYLIYAEGFEEAKEKIAECNSNSDLPNVSKINHFYYFKEEKR